MFIESQGPFPPKASLEREVFWNWKSVLAFKARGYVHLLYTVSGFG